MPNGNDSPAQRLIGQVKWFSDSKGYGFIEREDGADVFVHFSGIIGDGRRTLPEGARVEFAIGSGKSGPCAVEVLVVQP